MIHFDKDKRDSARYACGIFVVKNFMPDDIKNYVLNL